LLQEVHDIVCKRLPFSGIGGNLAKYWLLRGSII
jgi:hypothetical protein